MMGGGEEIVPVLLVGEAIVLFLMVGGLMALVAGRSLRDRRLASRLVRARRALEGALGGDEQDAVPALAALPPGPRLGAVSEFRSVLAGEERAHFSVLAERSGLKARAQRDLRSRRWWRRLRGVRTLGVLGGGGPELDRLLCDRNAEVRAAAAAWATAQPARATIQRLVALLEDRSPLVRFAAKNALLGIGEPAVGPLVRRLDQPGVDLAKVLEVAIGLADIRALEPALSLCRDSSADVRAHAVTLATAIGGRRPVKAALGLLDDPESEVRAAAIAGLGHLGHWPAGDRIAAALGDPAWDVRRQAGLGLRALGAPGTLLLRRALQADDRFARDMARQVLDLPDSARRLESA